MIDEKLKTVLIDNIGEPEGGFAESTSLANVDSLRILEIGIALEEAYGIIIEDEDMRRNGNNVFAAVGDLQEYLKRRTSCPA
jgi:acyl carrier protein